MAFSSERRDYRTTKNDRRFRFIAYEISIFFSLSLSLLNDLKWTFNSNSVKKKLQLKLNGHAGFNYRFNHRPIN